MVTTETLLGLTDGACFDITGGNVELIRITVTIGARQVGRLLPDEPLFVPIGKPQGEPLVVADETDGVDSFDFMTPVLRHGYLCE